MNVKNNIKLARLKCGELTQQQLAEKVKCSRQTVNSIEKGKFNPSVELALKMAKILNTTVEDLFYLEEDKG